MIAHILNLGRRGCDVLEALEELLAEAREGKRPLGKGEFQLLFSSADALTDAARTFHELGMAMVG